MISVAYVLVGLSPSLQPLPMAADDARPKKVVPVLNGPVTIRKLSPLGELDLGIPTSDGFPPQRHPEASEDRSVKHFTPIKNNLQTSHRR
ncbi:hypothetical protein EYF80_028401 [Liparis tanakae]|uniref:Uncharacterized protein n=1 Tax=Liparis tanakae TaxID=230148 RepID=A0A4Z2H948_9TELE|nr:hypothetical protein EYF80_028401 [Liparis tanakae]